VNIIISEYIAHSAFSNINKAGIRTYEVAATVQLYSYGREIFC